MKITDISMYLYYISHDTSLKLEENSQNFIATFSIKKLEFAYSNVYNFSVNS